MLTKLINVDLVKRVWKISWPTVIYSMMETLVGLIDLFWAGFLGNDALAAIGLCRQFFMVIMISAMAITVGTIAMTSQYYGAGRYNKASEIAYHSLVMAVIAGIVFGVLGVLLTNPVLHLLGAENQVLVHGTKYLRILMGGFVFLLIIYSTNGVFRALGDPKTPLKISIFTYILNALLSYIFVFGLGFIPAMGVTGIAIGMVLSRAFGAFCSIRVLSRQGRLVRLDGFQRVSLEPLWYILRIGIPVGIAGFLRNGARMVFFAIIASSKAGTAALAAAAIVFQIRMITIMPSLAFQVGVSALVGQSIGKKNPDEAEAIGWTSIKLCSFLMGIVSLIMFIMPGFIMHVFTHEPDVIRLGSLCMRFIVLEQIMSTISIVAGGVLSGSGDTKPLFFYTMIAQWFIMLPLAYFLTQHSSHDILGAWLAWGIAPVLEAGLIVSRFRGGKWKTLQVTSHHG